MRHSIFLIMLFTSGNYYFRFTIRSLCETSLLKLKLCSLTFGGGYLEKYWVCTVEPFPI